MKADDVHNLDDPQLVEFVDRSRQELFNLRFQHATGQLENTARLGQAKRELARQDWEATNDYSDAKGSVVAEILLRAQRWAASQG